MESTSDFDLGDEVTYEVQLGTNVSSISTVYSGQDTVFSTDTLITTYYWRVLANDLNGASTENNNGIQSFRINTLNDVPEDFALYFLRWIDGNGLDAYVDVGRARRCR